MNTKLFKTMMRFIVLSAFFLCCCYAKEPKWVIYWYLCGSDLETNSAAATRDLVEMVQAQEDVALDDILVVVQTGGAKQWHCEEFGVAHPKKSIRFSFGMGNDEPEVLEENPRANMGDPKTLKSFLTFCKKNYPGAKKMLLFWNHGGGSVSGVANDEQYKMEALSLDQIRTTLHEVYPIREGEEKPFEVVGFDACLMATIETAMAVKDHTKYMVASSELEPGCGWNYTETLTKLAKNPEMDGAALGKIICDAYMKGCKEIDQHKDVTLSVIDCELAGLAHDALNILGYQLLMDSVESNKIFAQVGRSVKSAEKYGPNSRSQGYTNMVDLGATLKGLKKVGEASDIVDMVLAILDQAVVYKVNGPYRKSSGLSFYYPLDKDKNNFNTLFQFNNKSTMLCMLGIQHKFFDNKAKDKVLDLIGTTTDESSDKLSSYFDVDNKPESLLAERQDLPEEGMEVASNLSKLEDIPVKVTNKGDVELTIPKEYLDSIETVNYTLLYLDQKENILLYLGSDAELTADWDKGVFTDGFRGVWPAIQGCLLAVEVTESNEDYNVYNSSIKLNGKPCMLEFIYDFRKERFEIIGARPPKEDGVVSRDLYPLKEGDKLTTVFVAGTFDDDNEPKEVDIDTITIEKNCKVEEMDLGDGQFGFMFDIVDVQGDSVSSDMAFITVKDGEMSVSLDASNEEETEEEAEEEE